MIRAVSLFLAIYLPSLLFCQRGANPISSTNQKKARLSNSYALVVGISNYQDSLIPDLLFAHKDAEAFADFLKSTPAFALKNDQIKLLTDQQATAASICIALDAVIEKVDSGDQVIIYFAGHGDVEIKRKSQPGYLLAWNAPHSIYMAGGTINLWDLQDMVSTLSIDKKAKVLLITDACHSGKLSGSALKGAQLTGENLNKQFANESKILSCQSNEYSMEGTQWGGGHGVFSYYLIQGMSGLADLNADAQISLFEIGRYLEDQVRPAVSPIKQIPLIIGDKYENIAQYVPIQPDSIFTKESFGAEEMQTLPKAEPIITMSEGPLQNPSGVVDEIPDSEDVFLQFNRCLKEKKFLNYVNNILQDEPGYAEFYYKQLLKDTRFVVLHPEIKSNYIIALIDESQQVVNNFLQDDLTEISLSKKTKLEKYHAYPYYLERASDLLGNQHYLYNDLQAQKLYFEAYLLYLKNQNSNQVTGKVILDKLHAALKWQEDFPPAYLLMSLVYAYQLNNPEKMEYFALQAIQQNKYWQSPYLYLIYFYSNLFKNDKKRLYYLDQAEELFPNSILLKLHRANYYSSKRKYKNARKLFEKAFQLDSNVWQVYYEFGNLCVLESKYTKAEWAYKKVIQLNPTNVFNYDALGNLYFKTTDFQQSELYYLKAIEIDSTYRYAFENLSNLYRLTGRYSEAEQAINQVIKLNPAGGSAYYYRACIFSLQNKVAEAYKDLETAFQRGFHSYELIQKQENLNLLKSYADLWNPLMMKYFPEQFK